ncbi:MAG: beta strand repeat-containing protein, partial [Flavisolibacter sp.]
MRKFYSRVLIILSILASGLSAQTQVVQIGTGTTLPDNTLYGPVYRFSATSTTLAARSNMLYTAAELSAAGIPSGAMITQVEFFKGNDANFVTPANFTMLMANTSNTALATTHTWASVLSTHTQVYTNASFNLPAVTGWVPWTLSTPFVYTGGALEIATEHTMAGNGGATNNITWQYSGVEGSSASLIVGATGTTLPATLNGNVADYKNRPNIRITFAGSACVAPPNPGTTTSSASLPICTGTVVSIGLTGQSFGIGLSFQLQSSATSGGTYTDVGTSQSGSNFNVSPTSTTWYRVGVTCSGNTQYSVPVEVAVSAGFPGGTYTINGALATGGTNFQTFEDAIDALSCGITGPVLFNVAPVTYEEQISIPPIGGSSAVNTITFYGNGATIQEAPVTGSRHIVQLDGADFITFRKLNIMVLSGTTFGWGFHLTNGADNNTIDSCTIDVTNVTSTTQSNSGGIVVSGSATSVLTDGSASNNIISNNNIIGAYQGIIINGATGALNAVNNIIRNNVIRDFYATGIEVTETNNILITDNNINRANRGTVGTFTGIELGAGNQNAIVSSNRIHSTHTIASVQTGTAYGIYASGDAATGTENRIFNNLIYNFDSESGIQYGLYNTSANGHYYYHNTIVLDDNSTLSNDVTKGIYQTTTASNIEFRNNIVYITRGGTGDKMAIHFNTTTSTIISNNNVFYVNATPGFIGGYGTTDYATFADWQGANGGAYDQQSLNVDPLFADVATGNFYPNNPVIAIAGATVGVTTDILGNTRNTGAPTPGAYEIVSPPCIAPPNPGTTTSSASLPICSGTMVSISLTGQSFGAGISFQLQSSTTSGGTYTDLGTSQSGPTFNVSPTSTTWYRVAVTCSGNTQYSVPVEVVVNAGFPGGTYTINGSVATGGTNFQTFAHAVNALSCGITGPVVFNVAPGTYEEQISLPAIGGTSAVNTITFNGNGAIIQYAPETGSRHIIQLDGADFVTFRKLNLMVLSGFNFGWGFHLTNGADNNTIDSCTIDVTNVTSTTQSNSGGIVVSGSATSVLTDGSASNNTISNNTIIGAYQGIIINGATGALNAANNIIRNNIIRDFYANGIEVTETSGILITDNDINRANRGTVGTFTGIELGAGNQNAIVSNNRIHSTHTIASAQTGTAYGIYASGDASTGTENRIFNNLIYNFDSESGIQYGLYNSGADGHYYYHNTIVLDDNSTLSNDVTKGIYQTTAASNIQFRNNIVYITRGGTGDKMAIHFNTTTSTIISNNNVLFVNATPGFIGGYGTTDFATLADWQGANGGAYDQQSVSVDPVFADAANANFYPNNSAISSIGAAVGVTTDIIGTTRSAGAPTPGAFEVVAAVGTDVGAVTLITPAQQACYSGAETITVQIRNYSANTHNFLSTPVTVNVAVTGPNATTFTPVVVNTGTLASDGTRNVIISTTYNMSAPGTYTFTAFTTVTGDVNALNDAMPAVVRTVEALEAGTLSSNPPSYCVSGGIPTLTLAGSSGGAIQWQTSASGDPGSWTNVGTDDTTYTPAAAITATTYFRTYSTCGANGDTSNVVAVNLYAPQLVSTTAASRCGPGSVTLTATPTSGYNINWYTAPSGGVP